MTTKYLALLAAFAAPCLLAQSEPMPDSPSPENAEAAQTDEAAETDQRIEELMRSVEAMERKFEILANLDQPSYSLDSLLEDPELLIETAISTARNRDLETAWSLILIVHNRYAETPQFAEGYEVASAIAKRLYLRHRTASAPRHWVVAQPMVVFQWLHELPEAEADEAVKALFRKMPLSFHRLYKSYLELSRTDALWDVAVEEDNGIIQTVRATRIAEVEPSNGDSEAGEDGA